MTAEDNNSLAVAQQEQRVIEALNSLYPGPGCALRSRKDLQKAARVLGRFPSRCLGIAPLYSVRASLYVTVRYRTLHHPEELQGERAFDCSSCTELVFIDTRTTVVQLTADWGE